jgi:catechol 2,3-dioxygenase-like lactoylglutathione lyase family enzyme
VTERGVHHLELWVADLAAATASWGWLLGELGWTDFQHWDAGHSWRLDGAYLVVEQSPALTGDTHQRTRPGLNHLALHAGSRADVDRLVAAAPAHGWQLLFADRHPHAGGPEHYAAYLSDSQGFEVELVAGP